MNSRSRATTLLETMLAASLLLLVMGASMSLLFALRRMQAHQLAYSRLVNQVAVVFGSLDRDLETVTRESTQTNTTTLGVVVALQGIAGVAAGGRQVWSDKLVYYRWAAVDERVFRNERSTPPLSTDGPETLAPLALQALLTPTASDRMLAADVKSWSVAANATLTVNCTMEAKLEGSQQLARYQALRTFGYKLK